VPFAAPAPDAPTFGAGDMVEIVRGRARRASGETIELLPVARRDMFEVVERTLGEQAARREASRCLQCASVCDKCVEVCPNRANQSYVTAPVQWQIARLTCAGGALIVAGYEAFEVRQTRQIVHIDDLCNECGNCATFCVHAGKPYADKPRLYLARDAFEVESDNAFHVCGDRIWRREKGQVAALTTVAGGLQYEDAHVRVCVDGDMQPTDLVLKQPFGGEVSLRGAAEMALLLRGLSTSLPWLWSGGAGTGVNGGRDNARSTGHDGRIDR
jgi:putative selenate reductase